MAGLLLPLVDAFETEPARWWRARQEKRFRKLWVTEGDLMRTMRGQAVLEFPEGVQVVGGYGACEGGEFGERVYGIYFVLCSPEFGETVGAIPPWEA